MTMTVGTFFLNNRRCLIALFERIEKAKKEMKKTTVLSTYISKILALIAMYVFEIPMYAIPEFLNLAIWEGTRKNIYGTIVRKFCGTMLVAISTIAIFLLAKYVIIPVGHLAILNSLVTFYTADNPYMSDELRIHVIELLAKKDAIYSTPGFIGWLSAQHAFVKIFAFAISGYSSSCLFRLALDQILQVFGRTQK